MDIILNKKGVGIIWVDIMWVEMIWWSNGEFYIFMGI
jgi:hypothetical protein